MRHEPLGRARRSVTAGVYESVVAATAIAATSSAIATSPMVPLLHAASPRGANRGLMSTRPQERRERRAPWTMRSPSLRGALMRVHRADPIAVRVVGVVWSGIAASTPVGEGHPPNHSPAATVVTAEPNS